MIDSLSLVSNQPHSHDLATSVMPFIAGRSNSLVQLALDHLHAGDTRFNPILFSGPTGFGKTLLLQTVCSQTTRASAICACADFARDFANAVEVDSVDDFRNTFDDIELLCLDDVQHLNTKPAAQHELCLLLDEFVATQRLVVATSTFVPVEGGKLSAQLVSRLSAGLAAPINPIDGDDCRQILRSLARRHDVTLHDDVVTYLATSATQQSKTARAPLLNHYVAQLVTESEAKGLAITTTLADQLFAANAAQSEPSLRSIASAVAKCFNLTSKEIRGDSRKQPIVRARGIAMLLARTLTQRSLEDVGRFFGNRDHSTVLHACRRTESLLNDDRDLNSLWHELQCSVPLKAGHS